MLKIEWKTAATEDDTRRDLRILHHHDPLVNGVSKWKASDVVQPLPSWKHMAKVAHERQNEKQTPRPPSVQPSSAADPQHDDLRSKAPRFAPHTTLWAVRAQGGDIDISDVANGTILQTIRQLKVGVPPTALRHVPYCSVYAADVAGTIFYGSQLARKTAFDQQLLHLRDEQRVQTDFVWVGFVDGTIRLVHARGYSAEAASKQTTRKEESDFFTVVHELPKCHSAEVVAFEMSPFHPTRAVPARDNISNPLNYDDAKQQLIANDLLPADRFGQYLCSASADSCVVVWDLADVYREIALLNSRQRRLEAAHRQGIQVGAKGPRVSSHTVTGLKRSSDPIYIDNLQFGEDDRATLVTFATFVASAKPLLRLKGTVCGMRHLRWTASVVTTKGHDRPRHVVAATRDIGDVEEQDVRRQLKLHQTQTRQEAREDRMRLLGLTEDEMQDAEHEMALRLPRVVDEPVCSKTVHFLVAGDANGYVMIWNLAEELARRAEPPRSSVFTSDNANGLSKKMLESNGRSPRRRQLDADVRSLASHVTCNATYLRSTDQRIQFSGGVSISGLEPLLPSEIFVTMRRAEPAVDVGATNDNMSAFDDTLGTPRQARAGEHDLVNEFLPLTDEVALYHAYKHLEIFVAVDGSVQFLSCHPAQLTRESEEQLYRLLDQNASPNRIEARRGVDDEVVGSLDFQTFSVFFSKRVIQYHTQPITAMRLDPLRRELWVARYDGMMSLFSTTKLKELCRVPHPHAYETCPPHTANQVERGLAEYHYLAGQPLHLEQHPESTVYSAKSFVRDFAPVQSDICDRVLCMFGDAPHNINEVVHTTTLPHDVFAAVSQTEAYVSERLQRTWAMREKRLAERNAAKQGALHRQRIKKRVDTALDRAVQQIHSCAIRGTVLAAWLRWATKRKTERVSSHTNKFAQREQDHALLWSDFVQQARAGLDENREARKKTLNVIAQTSLQQLLRSYLLRWHEVHQNEMSRRVEVPMIVGNNGMRLLRRFFAKWTDHAAHRSAQNTIIRQATRYQLIQHMQLSREDMHSAFLKWKRFSDTENRMNEWLSVHVDEHLITTTGLGVRTAVQQRYLHKWTAFASQKKQQRKHGQQSSRLVGPGGDIHAQVLIRHAKHAEERRRQSMMTRMVHYELDQEALIAQHFLEGSHLLCEAFASSADILEIDVEAGDDASVATSPAQSLSSFDALMNDISGRNTEEQHRVLLWTAIENLRCEHATMVKEQHQTASLTYWAVREATYLEVDESSPCETQENGDSNHSTVEAKKAATPGEVAMLLGALRSLAASHLVKRPLSLAPAPDKAIQEFPQLLAAPSQQAVGGASVEELCQAAVECVKQLLLPKLEELVVFTHSASTQPAAWEALVLGLDWITALEVDGSFSDAGEHPLQQAEGEEAQKRPLEYFDVAVTLTDAAAAKDGKLQKFVALARKVVLQHTQNS